MRSIEETQSRWQATQDQNTSLGNLQRAVKVGGPSSPCLSGCRSVCWKIFLLGHADDTSFLNPLRDSRKDYEERREHFLKYIRHPEALAEVAADPLADDADSPWNTVRQDEIVRAEILQDVQRLPEEVNYHDEHVQNMILDILFIHCKLYPGRGGYRQGMHELLAPIFHVIEQDAVDRATLGGGSSADAEMGEALDSKYIEHDAFALFSKLMENAQAFYEVSGVASALGPGTEQTSAIVERSSFIHQVCLNKIDPELAAHLTSIEILPQIFLIRWIRLLFSREFPFTQFLDLWDTIFAVNPSLDLIDLICCAMLLRIRWQLLEADYSVCLQLLLKYPPPSSEHGPQTFVDDALYLRDHLDAPGGETLILKYTGKSPLPPGETKGPVTPLSASKGIGSLRSPLRSPSSFSGKQSIDVESFFRGAAKGAKGVLERGEKLGINQAVREAVGEIRRNMQDFQDSRGSPRPAGSSPLSNANASKTLFAMERRNKQLARLLEETVSDLKTISASNLEKKGSSDSNNNPSLERIEVVAAKVQFVQIHLEDSSMELPIVAEVPSATGSTTNKTANDNDGKSNSTEPDSNITSQTPRNATGNLNHSESPTKAPKPPLKPAQSADKAADPAPAAAEAAEAAEEAATAPIDPLSGAPTREKRPAPIPTRSTLAQSSFSWMLEPDEPAQDSSAKAKKSPTVFQTKKKHSSNASRDRNAFLFGDDDGEAGVLDTETSMFGLEPIRRAKE